MIQSITAPMFCTTCGTHLADDSSYCTFCGKSTAMLIPNPAAQFSLYPDPSTRQLRRNRAKKKLAGVCAGFADYFGMDITLMRLIWVGLLIMPPYLGSIAYIVSWIVLPKSK